MSVPPIAKATFQAVVINAGSNVLAQVIKSYRDQFTTCALITSPLTFLWLENLETTFPGTTEEKPKTEKEDGHAKDEKSSRDGKKRSGLNVKNTVIKVFLDQTVGAAWNTVLFLTTMSILRGQDYDSVVDSIKTDFWPIMIAGFKMWPFVSILCFVAIPADKRLLVSSLFGVLWAIYLSLMSG
ncbi:hypothetical protein DTO280E4_5298 [Paecilomyces variotii]|nr:hypothetical protein DTO280E4_5298 [Paecilomyces variotii]